MLSTLKDITSHTFALGNIEVIKITGTKEETIVESMAEDKSVIIQAKLHAPREEFVGQFGMPNLAKLNVLLNIPEYKDKAQVTVTSKDIAGTKVLTGLHFENATRDFKNDYRFMSSELVNEKIKATRFKGVRWGVDFAPSAASVLRLKFMTQANSEETTFIAKTENGDLKFYFGDHSSHSGDFVFQHGVSGQLVKAWSWPIGVVNGVLALPGDKTFKFSDEGAAMITVDSGLAMYSYIMPAQQK